MKEATGCPLLQGKLTTVLREPSSRIYFKPVFEIFEPRFKPQTNIPKFKCGLLHPSLGKHEVTNFNPLFKMAEKGGGVPIHFNSRCYFGISMFEIVWVNSVWL